MPQTQIIGGGSVQAGVPMAVDPLFQAARFSPRPFDYAQLGQVLGHYRAVLITGTTVSIGAAGILAYLRWSDPSRYFVLVRLQAQALVASTITTGVQVDVGAYVARGSTAAGSGGTLVNLQGNNSKLRANMNASLITDGRVATTAALTAPTSATADANPFATYVTPVSFQTTAPASGTTGMANTLTPLQDLYKLDCLGQHPVILSPNEVLELQEISAGPTTGGIKWYFPIEWAEVASF